MPLVHPTRGLPPVVGRTAHLLILGSMPGRLSLARQQYYAHPGNRFWSLMRDLLDVGQEDYEARVAALRRAGVALWDVLDLCVRPGSLDAAIEPESEVPNDLAGFVARHPELEAIAFNGRKAAQAYRRHVEPTGAVPTSVALLELPSTSPANAACRPPELLARWGAIRGPLQRS